jgi:uncharacterized protein
MRPEKIVIDVNVFLASLFFKSELGAEILDSTKDRVFVLLSCDEFVSELKRKVGEFLKKRPQSEKQEIEFWFEFIERLAEKIQLKNRYQICRDPNDDYLVNLSIEGKAKYLVTRDKDILEIKDLNIDKIAITPEKFVHILRGLY